MFMGEVPIGTELKVRLQVDRGAQGSAVLAIAWSGGGQTGGHDECVAAPGGFCKATVTPGMQGLFRVVVDMNDQVDKGRLTVEPVTEATEIEGDQSWLYLVR